MATTIVFNLTVASPLYMAPPMCDLNGERKICHLWSFSSVNRFAYETNWKWILELQMNFGIEILFT